MEKVNTSYNHEYQEPTLVGIDLFSVIDKEKVDIFLHDKFNRKKHFRGIISKLQSAFTLIKENGNKIYILLPQLSNNVRKNEIFYNKISSLLISEGLADKVVSYGADFVGVCREYRFDVVCTRNTTIDIKKLDKVSQHIIENKFRNNSKDNVSLVDCMPDYVQLILFGDCSEKGDNVYPLNHIYQLADAIEKCKNSSIKRVHDIYKSYEYIPKTGIVSIDKEYKKYWGASKFENNQIDEITQKFSRFDFLKYHNRFNNSEEIIYLPREDIEIKITKEQRDKFVEQACCAFLKNGLKKGDVVTICSPNSLSDYILNLALNHIGVIVNPLHPLATTDKIERYFGEVHPRYFIYFNMETKDETVDVDYLANKYDIEKVIELSPVDFANPIMKKIYSMQTNYKIRHQKYKPRFIVSDYDKYETLDKLMKSGKGYTGDITVDHLPTDTAYYYSTGGTTSGKPSIVDLPYSMINLSYYNSYGISIEKGDAVFINYPRYIAFSDENCTHLPDSIGMKLVMTPYEYPSNFAQIMQKYKIKVLQMAPQFYEMILEDEKKGSFDGIDLSSVKYIVAGGDKMDDTLKQKLLDFFARHNNTCVQIIIGYGCTEVAGSSFVQLFNTNRNVEEGNIGIPLPVFDVKLINEDNEEVLDKVQKGRLLIGGDGYVMNGYLGDSEGTNKVLVQDSDNRCWYDTADIVEFCHDISVSNKIPNATANFITREKRFVMITNANCSGKAIPDEIERLIVNTIQGVKQCCVVGIKEHDEMVLKAAITLEDGYEFNEEMDRKIKLVSSSKDILNTISEVQCIDSMPLTDRQKIKYRDIEEMFLQNQGQNVLVKK